MGNPRASTLVLMDCPGGPESIPIARRSESCFNPCFNGLSRRTVGVADQRPDVVASTLVLMDCPGGPAVHNAGGPSGRASTLVLMDCPGGPGRH